MDISSKTDIWNYLQNTEKAIILYGTGDGADKIIDALHRFGREPDDYFASDGFVRGQSFHGKRVLSLSEIEQKYDNFLILQSFGTCLPDVMSVVRSLSDRYEYYAPDVPLYGGELFTYEYYLQNRSQIDSVYELLYDERSKKVYRDIIEYKLTGKLSYLKDSSDFLVDTLESIFTSDYEYYCDGGAYRGESSVLAGEIFPSVERIYSFEPDPNAFKKLCTLDMKKSIRFDRYNAVLSDKNEKVAFYNRKNRSSSACPLGNQRTDGKSIVIDALTLDSVICEKGKGLIKLDVEGKELDALKGAVGLIKTGVDLQVSLYHKSCDIFTIPLFLNSVCKDAKFYIRRVPYIPAWDVYLSVIQN